MTRRPRLLISAGPTREPIDPVRFLSNYSTGYVGACLAREALRRGCAVTVVAGPTSVAWPAGARVVEVERAREMRAALRRLIATSDALIMAAAVADFEPVRPRGRKISRQGRLVLELRATPDIVAGLPRRPGQVFAGFALETADAPARARAKLRAKRLDVIVGQQMVRGRSPFGKRRLFATLLTADGRTRKLGAVSKPRLARALLDEVEQLWYGARKLDAGRRGRHRGADRRRRHLESPTGHA